VRLYPRKTTVAQGDKGMLLQLKPRGASQTGKKVAVRGTLLLLGEGEGAKRGNIANRWKLDDEKQGTIQQSREGKRLASA